jgi:hypothetical protein
MTSSRPDDKLAKDRLEVGSDQTRRRRDRSLHTTGNLNDHGPPAVAYAKLGNARVRSALAKHMPPLVVTSVDGGWEITGGFDMATFVGVVSVEEVGGTGIATHRSGPPMPSFRLVVEGKTAREVR